MRPVNPTSRLFKPPLSMNLVLGIGLAMVGAMIALLKRA